MVFLRTCPLELEITVTFTAPAALFELATLQSTAFEDSTRYELSGDGLFRFQVARVAGCEAVHLWHIALCRFAQELAPLLLCFLILDPDVKCLS